MRAALRLLGFVGLVGTLCVHTAAAEDLDAVIQGIETAYKDVQSLKADFVQVTHNAAMGEATKQRGKLEMKRPKMMRWSFGQPAGKLFVTDGKTMWVWSEADNQVIVSPVVATGGGQMTQLLDGLDSLSTLFDVSLLSDAAGPEKRSYSLRLVPKTPGSFQSLDLVLARKDFIVQKLAMLDAFGNRVELNFQHVKLNASLSDDQFAFTIPDGAQVIRTDGP
jgi:outer membrane lipoprotein carrier protein